MTLETAVVVVAVMSVLQTAFMGMRLVLALKGHANQEEFAGRLGGAVERITDTLTGQSPSQAYTVRPCNDHWHVVGPDRQYVGDEHYSESSANEIAAMLNARHGYKH